MAHSRPLPESGDRSFTLSRAQVLSRLVSLMRSAVRYLAWFARELVHDIIADRLQDVAAQLAYNSLLALFPFLIFLMTVLAYLPVQGVADQILATMADLVPSGTMPIIAQTVYSVVKYPNGRLLAIAIAGSMWAASGGVAALTGALNSAYDVKESRSWIRVRLRSMAITLAATVLLIVATIALMIGPPLIESASAFFGWGLTRVVTGVWSLLRWPATVAAMSGLLALFYWACPNVRQPFRAIVPGAVVAIPAWIGASELFNLYVSHLGSFNKTYGALGTGVVLLIWIYLSGFIVLAGGEINAILWRGADHPRHRRVPTPPGHV